MHAYPHYSFQLGQFSNLRVWGTGGEGYALFAAQTTDPTTPAAGYVKLFSDSTVSNIARLSMRTSSGAVLTFFRDAADTVRNASGGAFTKGQVVYKNGANGTTATIDLAKADVAATAGAVGLILAPTLANNSFGTIITHGRFQGVDTTSFSQGDVLYVSPTTAGALTNVRPTSPDIDVKVGTVVTSSANGIVDLTFQPYVPTALGDLNNVLFQRSFAKGPTALVFADIGITVQAYDADLTTWAGITPGANVGTALAIAVGVTGAFAKQTFGSWTPAPDAGTFSAASGTWTQIGRTVVLTFDFTVGTGGGSTVTIPIASAITTAVGIYTSGQDFAAGTTAPTVVIGGGGSTMYFRTCGDNVAFSAMTFTAGAAIAGSITYVA